MNPTAAGMWNNPPPPGIDEDQEEAEMIKPAKNEMDFKVINRIDPFVKSPEYVEYETRKSREHPNHRRHSRSRSRHRTKSRSKDCDRKRTYRSKSKRHHRRSRSRSRGHHRHRSRSRSTSPSQRGRYRHKDRRHRHSPARFRRHSRSSSKSRSRSRNRKHHYSKSSRKSRTYSRSPASEKNEYTDGDVNKDDDKIDEEDSEALNKNAFKNDGSFFELYKKMQEEQQKADAAKAEAEASVSEVKKPIFGKRRGGRVLKTGVVVKSKTNDELEGTEPQDPWSIYLKEVKRYKEACCDDDSKTRPLVK